MKKILITALAISLAAATQVGALTVTVTTVSGYNVGQGGGEFNVSPVTGVGYAPSVLVGAGFETFCIAKDVGIAVPGTYTAVVDATGHYNDSYTTTKVLSGGTAWLYQQFASGALAGYHYADTAGGTASGRAADAYNLQLAIWTLEGGYGYGSLALDLGNKWIALVASRTQFGGDGIAADATTAGLTAAMAANVPGGYGVGSLRLTGDGTSLPLGTPVQSMLTLLPDGGTTLMLMGIGFSSLALISRKYRA